MDDFGDSTLNSKLMAKIADQARELSALNHALEESTEYAGTLKARLAEQDAKGNEINFAASGLSSAALQRKAERQQKEQLDSLHRLLETSEQRLVDSNKVIAKLTQEADNSLRASRQYERKVNELNRENQRLIAQLEAAVRVTNPKQSSLASTLNTRNSIALAEDLHKTKAALDRCQKELEKKSIDESEMKIKIQVLDDALNFRAEEIGLAGQADLLARVASLRGEVSALRSELGVKRGQLEEAEGAKSELAGKQDSLQRQVSLMQQRLTQSQEELKRIQIGDIHAQFRTVQQERDVLLDFIQGDMEKSSVLAKQIEKLESDLRVQEQVRMLSDRRAESAEHAAVSEAGRLKEALDNQASMHMKLNEVLRINDLLKSEIEQMKRLIDRKELEVEELTKMHCSALSSLKSKEENRSEIESELIHLRTTLKEQELNSAVIQRNNDSMQERLQIKEKELAAAREGINSMEPRVAQLEPEVLRLRREREQWMQERIKLQTELAELRPVDKALGDLISELSELKLITSPARNSNSVRDRGLDESGMQGLWSAAKSGRTENTRGSLSRSHAAWIGLPSLRVLSPELYECIRHMASDLTRKEAECAELESTVQVLKLDLDAMQQVHSNNQMRLLHTHELSDKALEECREKLLISETELSKARGAKTTLDQIRSILLSFPGFSELIASSSFQNQKEFPSTPDKSAAEEIKQPSDQTLPDLVGRALMYNANAVIALQDSRAQLEETRRELLQAQMQQSGMNLEINEFKRLCEHLQQTLKSKDESFANIDRELRQELDAAVELAEKQNSLALTLDSKLENIKRERQLKSAQLTSMQQREDAMAMRLSSALKDASQQVGYSAHQIPEDGSRLPELIQLVVDVLTKTLRLLSISSTRKPHQASHSRFQASASVDGSYFPSHPAELTGKMFDRGNQDATGEHAPFHSSVLPSSSFLSPSQLYHEDGANPFSSGRPISSSVPSSQQSGQVPFSIDQSDDTLYEDSMQGQSATRYPSGASIQSRGNPRNNFNHASSVDSHSHSQKAATDVLTPSKILQSRLKKAQQAFAAMREPL